MTDTDANIGIDLGKYKLGWSDEEDYVYKPRRGLDEELIREMSAMKKEPSAPLPPTTETPPTVWPSGASRSRSADKTVYDSPGCSTGSGPICGSSVNSKGSGVVRSGEAAVADARSRGA